MNTRQNRRIGPSELSPETLRGLEALVRYGRPATLVGLDGQRVELPDAVNDLLVFVVDAAKHKEVLFLMHEDAALTTQVAARFLGVSRPYLLRLLDADKLPFHRVGTHRRIMLCDLQAYQARRDEDRRQKLDS